MEELFFEGKKYISSKRAAQESGYTKDYIGQLCRGRKLDARMVGRSWYIAEDSIEGHGKHFQGEPVVQNAREKLQKQKERRAYVENQTPLTYTKDENPLLPPIVKTTSDIVTPSRKLKPSTLSQGGKQNLPKSNRRIGQEISVRTVSSQEDQVSSSKYDKEKGTRLPKMSTVFMPAGIAVLLIMGIASSLLIEKVSTYERIGSGEYRLSESALSVRGLTAVVSNILRSEENE